MALDYAPALDRHDVRRKVGVITRAEIVGRKLELGGYLFAKDFPEIVKELGRAERRYPRGIAGTLAAPQLGMSYEIADARVADVKAKVWTLTRATFTGAGASCGEAGWRSDARRRTDRTRFRGEAHRLRSHACAFRGMPV
jgi:hypothetical protein